MSLINHAFIRIHVSRFIRIYVSKMQIIKCRKNLHTPAIHLSIHDKLIGRPISSCIFSAKDRISYSGHWHLTGYARKLNFFVHLSRVVRFIFVIIEPGVLYATHMLRRACAQVSRSLRVAGRAYLYRWSSI